MKSLLFLILFIGLHIPLMVAQAIPDGYILQYGQNFSSNKGIQDFSFSWPSVWVITRLQGNYFLQSTPQAPGDFRSISPPPNRAILKNRVFGDFVLEADVMPVPGEAPQEICLFLGLKDSTRYYFVLLSTDPASDLPGIYLVKNSLCSKLTVRSHSPGALKTNTWQKIRIERNIVKRTIRVFTGTPAQMVMEVTDYELVMGSLGFGSLYSAARFDNLSVWAPTMIIE
jgi:hypothetical protein